MLTYHNSTDRPTDLRNSADFIISASPKVHARPVLSPEFDAWRLADLIQPLENTISALPLPKSLFKSPPAKTRPCILVVDDDTFNFDLLGGAFDSDYEVLFAIDGITALQIAIERAPDLILLDVMMPDVDGYEVCRCLKAQRRTRDIPVIFITGLDDTSSETTGLELGAVDYITKPINATAVRARANNQIRLKWTLERLVQAAAAEKTLRDDLLEVLELKSRGQQVS
jgi:PleD family two-component response regulator